MSEAIKEKKRGYIDTQKSHILEGDANRNFFKHVKNFSHFEKPEQFDVRTLLPGKSYNKVGKVLTDYFIQVSRNFDPLKPGDIPAKKPDSGTKLEAYEVAARLKKLRKPKSMVPDDIFPKLVTQFSDFLAIPLTAIYNEILQTYIWPVCWKREFVTIIPKKSNQSSLGDLRNISCTMLAGKVFESFVLNMLKLQVKTRTNQYGGFRGLRQSPCPVLANNSPESRRLSRRDSHNLQSWGSLSTPREVWGGCSQGSILGVYLFNITIDDLEDGCQDLTQDPSETVVMDAETESEEEIQHDPQQAASTPIRRPASMPCAESPVGVPGNRKNKKR